MINVIGLGYIGLPTALMMASHGVEVIGTDYNKELVATLNAGKTTFKEKGLDELFQNVAEGSLFIDDARRTAIGAALRKRVQMLKEHAAAGKAFTQGADISGDVQADVAYSGKTE